jgi:O-antigen/teichoic acid export membrane protein
MEVKKGPVILNVISSGAQVLVIGIVYFFLYKYLLSKLGVELLGVWSVVLSTSSLATLANFGVADSVVRFVALYLREENMVKIKELIFTASLFLFSLFVLISLIIYPFASLILKGILPLKFIQQGLTILPFSLVCLVINSVNGVFSSVLDGMQKNYLRNSIFVFSSISLLFFTYYFVPKFGLKGVAYAQVIQSLLVILSCFILVVRYLDYNPFKWNWSKDVFAQIFSYGIKFQFISIATMLNDPITKIFLGKFGGMAFTGYYEMANRLINQARGVIVNSNQALVPVMVGLTKEELPGFYKRVFSNVFFFSLAAVGILALSVNIISFYWIGNHQPIFCNTVQILAFSLLINLLCGPAYFYYMADGKLNKLIKTQIILGAFNLILSAILGYYFKGYGVIFAWTISVLLASFYLILVFNRMYKIGIFEPFIWHDLFLFLLIPVFLIMEYRFISNLDSKWIDLLFTGLFSLIILAYFIRNKYKVIRGI